MGSTGIVRKLDSLNRVVVPVEICRTFRLEPGTPMDIHTDGDKIILQKYTEVCSACGQPGGLVKFKAVSLCPECRKELK